MAVIRGNSKIAKLLIQNGANVNAQDHRGWTPMHHAAKKGDIPMMKTLKKLGADLNIKTSKLLGTSAKKVAGCKEAKNLLTEWEKKQVHAPFFNH